MTLGEVPDYPWDLMAPYVARARAAAPLGSASGVVDLSVGSPVDPTPAVVQAALASATNAHAYPQAVGTLALREAIANWFDRRRGVPGLTPDTVLPTIGSKELVAFLPFFLGLGEGDAVVHPRAAYPTYAVGAAFAGAQAIASDNPAEWPRNTRLVWLNSPGNPDGRVLSVQELRVAVSRAREIGAYVASDECYAELGWEAPWGGRSGRAEPIPSVLDPRVVGADHRGVLALYSLSKQSNLAGYRAAFVAGDSDVIARLATVRKHAGLILPSPLQAAMVAALGDDAHVVEQRERYRTRRELLMPAMAAAGFRIDRSEAGLYLWATEGRDAWESIGRLADVGIVAGPGIFYGEHFPQHVRLSLTATDERVAAAAARLHSFRDFL